MSPDLRPDPKATRNERVKLTAAYLNAMATSTFAAGVVAPAVAIVFGLSGLGGPVPPLTLVLGVTMFFGVSVGLHAAARYVLRSLKS